MVSHVNRLTDQVKAADNVGNFLVNESKIIKPAQFVSSPGQNLDVLVEYMAYALASREKDGIYHTYVYRGRWGPERETESRMDMQFQPTFLVLGL